MKAAVKVLVLTCVVLVMTGCGVNAKWTLKSITPESAREHFDLQMICLMNDGHYMMRSEMKGAIEQKTGTYEFDRKAEKLTFKGDDGVTREYGAKLLCPGSELKVWSVGTDSEFTAILKHAGACPKECCCQPKTCNPEACKKPCPEKAEKAQKFEKHEKAEKVETHEKAEKAHHKTPTTAPSKK
jgi:hypothetical protein